MQECTLSRNSLNNSDVFILDLGEEVYQVNISITYFYIVVSLLVEWIRS